MADPPHFVKYAQPVIRVRVFAGLRERAGWSEKELEGVERVADVWPALDLGEEPPGLLYAVNRAYADRDQELADGDEVALIPPVSGGAFLLSEEPLSLDAAVARGRRRTRRRDRHLRRHDPHRLARPDGAAPRVRGVSRAWPRRSWNGSREELESKYELCEVAIHHRVGRVGIGETSVVIAVSAPHRQDALAACKEAIDTLKETVPLWKKEVYEGGEEWIGRGS